MITPTSRVYEYFCYAFFGYFMLLCMAAIVSEVVKVWRQRHGR